MVRFVRLWSVFGLWRVYGVYIVFLWFGRGVLLWWLYGPYVAHVWAARQREKRPKRHPEHAMVLYPSCPSSGPGVLLQFQSN